MKVITVIPAYNEERTVGEVVRQVSELQAADYRLQVLVVDDGSKDRTAAIARAGGASVLTHPINRGLGAALSTGITGALAMLKDDDGVIVTLDGDGQHEPAEIPKVIAPILKGGTEVVIGSRFMETAEHKNTRIGVPWSRVIANFCGNFFTWFLFGIWVSDSQSGFRAFSKEAAQKMRLRTSTMEVSSEIIREISRNKLKMATVPITVRYTPYTLSKGQGFLRGLETLWKLVVLKFFR